MLAVLLLGRCYSYLLSINLKLRMYKTIILPAVSVSATLGLSHVNMKISFGHLGMDGIFCMEYSFVKNTLFTLDRVNIGEGYINWAVQYTSKVVWLALHLDPLLLPRLLRPGHNGVPWTQSLVTRHGKQSTLRWIQTPFGIRLRVLPRFHSLPCKGTHQTYAFKTVSSSLPSWCYVKLNHALQLTSSPS